MSAEIKQGQNKHFSQQDSTLFFCIYQISLS